MRALFGFDPDRSARNAAMAEEFERVLSFWGRDYVVQMLRGPGSPYGRMLRSREVLDRVIHEEIAHRRRSGERGQDILSLLLDATDEDGTGLSDQELRDQVMTLLFAGHDTTTSTVTFLFYELARNPEERARPRRPIATARLDMAVDETLRMYPPAWIGPGARSSHSNSAAYACPAACSSTTAPGSATTCPRCFPSLGASGPIASRRTRSRGAAKGRLCPVRRRLAHLHRDALRTARGEDDREHDPAPLLARPRGAARPLSIRQMPTLSPRGGLPVVVRPPA